jgi:hypothetical protein
MTELQTRKVATESNSYTSANYWAPFSCNKDNNKTCIVHNLKRHVPQQNLVHLLAASKQPTQTKKNLRQLLRGWLQQRCCSQHITNNNNVTEVSMVLDSGTTSHFA